MTDIHSALVKIKDLTWQEVFSIWHDAEANMPHWIEHYKKRGFNSWEEWRKNSISDLKPETLSWALYEIQDPLKTIPKFYGGPFRPWIEKYFGGKRILQFSEIAKNSAVGQSERINEILHNFPAQTALIGLKTEKGIVLIEGLHRCSALALATAQDMNIHTKVTIALADYCDREIPLMGQSSSPA